MSPAGPAVGQESASAPKAKERQGTLPLPSPELSQGPPQGRGPSGKRKSQETPRRTECHVPPTLTPVTDGDPGCP